MKPSKLVFSSLFFAFSVSAQTNLIQNSGFIGIGTLSPSSPLHVHGITTISDGSLKINSTLNNSISPILFLNHQNIQKGRIWVSNSPNSVLNFSSSDNNADITINDAGKVGISNPAPVFNLDVGGNLRCLSLLNILPSNGTTFEGGEIQLHSNTPYLNWHLDAYKNFFRVFSSNLTTALLIKDNGFVGIGLWNDVDEKLHISNGNVKIDNGNFFITNNGTTNFKVELNGFVTAREIQVHLNTIPDYVFLPDYKLMTFEQLRTFISNNGHLPNVPSQSDVTANDNYINVGEFNKVLLEKIEELTLYILELEDRLVKLENSK